MLATALNLVMGYAGQFAKANVAFMGSSAIIHGPPRNTLGHFILASMARRRITFSLCRYARALPLQLRGLYLAILSISFVLIVHWCFIHLRFLSGGAAASQCHPLIRAIPISDTMGTYYLSLVTMLITMWIARNIVASALGARGCVLQNKS